MNKTRATKHSSSNKSDISYGSIPNRLKAFLIDIFIIMLPILYFITYIILGSKEEFQKSLAMQMLSCILYGIIIIIFWIKTGQTPGYKAYDLKLLDEKKLKEISIIKAIVRYIISLVSGASIIGLLIAIFRTDNKTFHDILSGTVVVDIEK